MIVWVVAGLLLLTAVVAGAYGWRARRRARVRRKHLPGRLRHPILLAHGVLGFDRIRVAGTSQAYFRGVPEALADRGVEVHLVRVPALASIAERAAQLAQAVRAIDAKKVNVIAHSMGGLDARYAISALGLSAKVASLTTVGSPHRGTPLADLGTGFFGDTLRLRALFEKLGLDVAAFYDLTTARMAAFNASVLDAKGVFYGCYLGHLPNGPRGSSSLLWPAYRYLHGKAGENDGLVPVSSQSWGEVLGDIEADHWGQIGWSTAFDAPAFYSRVLDELRGRGL